MVNSGDPLLLFMGFATFVGSLLLPVYLVAHLFKLWSPSK